MKYLILTREGNGYHCSCCRRTWETHETMEFDSDDKLKEYIKNWNDGYNETRLENDSKIIKAYQLMNDEPVWEDC